MRIFSRSILCGLAVLFLVTAFSAGADAGKNDFKPDNAAYWYLKAYELNKQSGDMVPELLRFFQGKTGLTAEVDFYIANQKPVIDMVKKAAGMKKCEWKYDPAANIWDPDWQYLSLNVSLFFLMAADTKIKEMNNKYSEVIDNCNSVFRFLDHLECQEDMALLMISRFRMKCCQYIKLFLNNNASIDVRYLESLYKTVNSVSSSNRLTLSDILKYRLKSVETVFSKSKNSSFFDSLIKHLDMEKEENDQILKFAKEYGIDKIRNSCLSVYREYTNDHLIALKTPGFPNKAVTKAREKYNKKAELADDFMRDFEVEYSTSKNNDFVKHLPYWLINKYGIFDTVIAHEMELWQKTELNALRVAIPILIEYRRSGELPDVLEKDINLDMYGNKPFEFIKGKDNFVLKSTKFDTKKKEYTSYEFKLPVKEQK